MGILEEDLKMSVIQLFPSDVLLHQTASLMWTVVDTDLSMTKQMHRKNHRNNNSPRQFPAVGLFGSLGLDCEAGYDGGPVTN